MHRTSDIAATSYFPEHQPQRVDVSSFVGIKMIGIDRFIQDLFKVIKIMHQ